MMLLLYAAAANSRCALAQSVGGLVAKRWTLEAQMPYEPNWALDGSSCGPPGVVTAAPHVSGSCHEAVCNVFTSAPPHVFHLSWCASTENLTAIGCSLDVGYRSATGATTGRFGWTSRGLAAADDAYTWLPTSQVYGVGADRYAFDALGSIGEKDTIDTVFQIAVGSAEAEGLPLTEATGFCCRAEFSGASGNAGTIYFGDLEVRSGCVAPGASPSPSQTPSASANVSASSAASATSTSSSTSTATSTATSTLTGTATATSTATATGGGAAAAAGLAPGMLALSASDTVGAVLGALAAGVIGTLAARAVAHRLRGGARGGAHGGAFAATSAGERGASAAALERAALIGRVIAPPAR
jgi:hypothetical protein